MTAALPVGAVEIAVVDGERPSATACCRRPCCASRERAATVDAVVSTPATAHPSGCVRHAVAGKFVNLREPARMRLAREFAGMRVTRSPSTATFLQRPGRSRDTVLGARVSITTHSFGRSRVSRTGRVMTEKDAVKCRAFARESWWYLPVAAQVDPALAVLVLDKLKRRHGP
jgi:tetraacyldisaccharide 4'-kinase